MKILSASIISAGAGFLHAGYISAYPRTVEPIYLFQEQLSDSAVQLDIIQALQLKGDAAASAVTNTDSSVIAGWFGSLGSFPTLLFGMLSVFGLLALLYLMRDRWRQIPAAVGVIPLALIVALATLTCADEAIPDAPWLDLEHQQYENPEAATQAILYGILGPAIEYGNLREFNPASVLNEVGLPTPTLTPGMEYALQSYGLDGWGNEFRLAQSQESESYVDVTSAGPDETFGTDDDIDASFHRRNDGNFDWPSSLYFRKYDDDYVVFFHRFEGKLYRYRNRDKAAELTGGELFDCFGDLSSAIDGPSDEVITYFENAYADLAEGQQHQPLMLYVLD